MGEGRSPKGKDYITGTGILSLEFLFQGHGESQVKPKVSHQGSVLCPHGGMARRERERSKSVFHKEERSLQLFPAGNIFH